MNRFIAIMIIIWSLVLVGCASTQVTQPSREEQENDIREAVFRYILQECRNQEVCYLSFSGDARFREDNDPSKEFMQRFRGHKPLMKKVSQCASLKGTGIKSPGKKEVILFVGAIKWISDIEVEAKGGSYLGSLSAIGFIYRVVREGNRWVVKEAIFHWIS